MREGRITAPVAWRAATDRSGPGTLTITALRIGEQARDRREVFDQAPRTPDNGVTVGRLHSARKAPIVRAQAEVRDGALVVTAKLPDTAAGRDAAVEVRNGTLPEASVEFRALRDTVRNGVRHVLDSIVEAVALVPSGSYRTAAEVRQRAGRLPRRR